MVDEVRNTHPDPGADSGADSGANPGADSGAGAGQEPGREGRGAPPLPADALILLPVRNTVLFPGMVLPLAVGRRRSVAAAQEAVRSERPLGVILQKDPEVETPTPEDLYRVGTEAQVLRFVTGSDGTHHIICQGQRRFRIVEFLEGYPYFAARVEPLEERVPDPDSDEAKEIEARFHTLKQKAVESLQLMPQVPAEVQGAIQGIESPSQLADLVAGFLDLKPEEKQEILETVDLRERLEKVTKLLVRRIEVLRLSQEIEKETQASMEERQREYLLREQLKTIQKQLGESDAKEIEIRELEEAIAKAGMPPEVEEQARKELARLERMPEGAAEYAMLRTYLDWLVSLPWSKSSEEHIDIAKAREILDQDHYDLEKVKRRILEFLAVRKLNPEGRGPILCFVGPPGVGKTSLGQSIAKALGRRFVRIALGGVHDEAEIRGHRRTYVGAMPGNIIQALRKAGTNNPVFMLDELDKLGAGFHGDPSAALLEVLDPEQNSTFRDNYLGVPFDLSRVMFIGTANVLDAIPGPLRDRMEVIELPGYTDQDKLEIAKRYLVARQLKENGLSPEQCRITDAALMRIIREYTREAGCRNLEREIGAVCRHVAMRIAEGESGPIEIDAGDLPAILGPPRYESETAMRTSVPGVATGLAWTPTGGDLLFIEAARTPGRGKLILTGQLGDVMKESAQAALSLVKARAQELGIDPAVFEVSDIHIHVPAGAIPKDGPSAGVAIYVALVSLLTGRKARADTAMTGEISLRGLVLPVGGIKEKTLAAARAGIRRVILPARNRKDLEDVPQHAREALEFIWIERVEEALAEALEEAPAQAGAAA
ncbi:MAG: endopeptidase La [Gammaproteobacteria bacterium]|nr:MAG: endopeptidase La [Gammaproteobacteria bacterium]